MQRLGLSSRYMFVNRIGNEKVTVYFQLIARKCRISNSLLQDRENLRDRKFYSIEEKMAESTSYCNSNLKIEGFIF